jgi:TolB-like protein/Flp pilus assembly protein TadD
LADPPAALAAALRDRYVLERELGRGGMATVFLAHDVKHDRPVALKVLLPELAASLGPDRFQREIRLAARLQHPHILTVHDSGETAGQLWFTMPFVEGESLRERLRRERQLSVEDAVQIGREAARALDYAHQHGIIHRDIKPENILLTRDGSTLVADFGIARALGGAEEQLTQTGMSVGTPAYMSPEQAAGERSLDARTDIYSLGAVLYEMLAGEPPYGGPTVQAMLLKRLTDPVPSVRRVRPSVPEPLDYAVQKALAPVLADRYATAGQFAQALQAATTSPGAATAAVTPAADLPPQQAPASAAPVAARARRMPVGAITLAVGFLIGLGVLFAWRRAHPASEPGAGGEAKLLAVLPFENLGGPEDEYFADGITDEVRGKLSAVPGLHVIASGSASQYKHTTKPPQEIGRELGVDYLLVGKIRWEKRAGGASRVRVSPELVEVSPGTAATTKWQQPFDAALNDVFQVQADIASRVAQALDIAIGAGQREALAEKPTANLLAYDAFLKGEGASIGSDVPSQRRAIGFYEQAVALDSTFEQAWAHLARAHALVYYLGAPTAADAEAARAAAERAVALGPGRADGQLAIGTYHHLVRGDLTRAVAAYETGLRLAPERADLLAALARAEMSLGRWDAALDHFRGAQALDPRSGNIAWRLATELLWLRRYPEALDATQRGLTIAPNNLDLLETRTMISLAQGDLAGARGFVRQVPAGVEPTAFVAYFGIYWDLYWVLDDPQQQLLLRLTPSAFDNDRAIWGLVIAQTYASRGDMSRARAYADSARVAIEDHLKATPDDPSQHTTLGLALAYAGRKEEAIREAARAIARLPMTKDARDGAYFQHQAARVYLLVGEPEKALDQLELLLKVPYYLSPGWLRIDPTFAALKGNPRFEKLVGGS